MGSHNRDEELVKLFNALDEKKAGFISQREFTEALQAYGVQKKLIREAIKFLDTDRDGKLKAEDFLRLKEMKSNLIERALKGQVAIPDWGSFVKDCEEIFEEVRSDKSGHIATYIPQLARVDPEQFAIAITSVDGQVWASGDCEVPFTIQSCSKPITYCMAEKSRGVEKVKKHVGHEPSGQAFNAFILDTRNPREMKPHNPMINAGAIMCASLLEPEAEAADRFDHVLATWKRLASENLGFDNATYLSELSHADRNFALAYFMKDAGAFEESMDNSEKLRNHLQFYFQLCSITANTKQMANVAATLANGGTCPFTDDSVFDAHTIRNCLSLMFSCGMYDYSGEFAYGVGLPAKSGVAGCVYAVIPNLLGICVWSPRLDQQGNSHRAVRFFEKLTERFAFHVFDEVSGGNSGKKNPRLRQAVNQNLNVISEMCYAAANGDLTRIMEMVISGVSVDTADYDGRTPLHLAAAEGREKVAEFLVNQGANVNVRDRWGATPRAEAEKYKHQEVLDLLLKKGAEN